MQAVGQLAREQLCRKGQGILGHQKLNVGHQCVLAAGKANDILGCTSKSVAQGNVFSDGTCETTSGALCSRLGSLVQKKALHTGLNQVDSHQGGHGTGAHGIQGEAQGTGFVQP